MKSQIIDEFRCQYCGCWFESAQAEQHFMSVHDQKGVSFEKLSDRLSSLGGLEVRQRDLSENTEEHPVAPPKKGNWLFQPDSDVDMFETNNFQHSLRGE